jgi:hypothetical protein
VGCSDDRSLFACIDSKVVWRKDAREEEGEHDAEEGGAKTLMKCCGCVAAAANTPACGWR